MQDFCWRNGLYTWEFVSSLLRDLSIKFYSILSNFATATYTDTSAITDTTITPI